MPKGKRQENQLGQDIPRRSIIIEKQENTDEPLIVEEQEEQLSDDFKKIVNQFQETEGWVHVKLKRGREPIVKIGKYRPGDFDADEIAKQYGGGTYLYALYNEKGKKVKQSEETYAEMKEKPSLQANPANETVNQMISLVKDLTDKVANLQAKVDAPKQDNTSMLMIEMMKQSNQQMLEITKAIAGRPSEKSNDFENFSKMFTMIQAMFPKQEPQEKPSIAEAVELANALSDFKSNGGETSKPISEMIKDFITDGSLGNLLQAFKKQPIIPPVNSQPETTEMPVLSAHNQIPVINPILKLFKMYEKNILDLKIDGNSSEDIANTILSLASLDNSIKQAGYEFFANPENAVNTLYANTEFFKNDKPFLQEITNAIHSYYYGMPEQDTEETNKQKEFAEELKTEVTENV